MASQNEDSSAEYDEYMRFLRRISLWMRCVWSRILVTSADTMFKVPTHFYRGCAYTVSAWVYLYRQSNCQNERVIFVVDVVGHNDGV